MKAKPVLHVIGSLGIGGTEKNLQLLVTHLDRTRFTPYVFAEAGGVRLEYLRKADVPVFIGHDFLAVLEQIKPSIVHLHRGGWTEPRSGRILRDLSLSEVPVVLETNVFGRVDPSPKAAIIRRHLYVSNFCRQRLIQTNSIKAEDPKHVVLYNPVDADRFGASVQKTQLPVENVLKTAGRISRPVKGKWSKLVFDFLPYLIRFIPDFTFRVVGAIPEFIDFVQSKGLEENVIFHPLLQNDPEIADFFSKVNVLAHANDTGESFGMVIAEAMAAGLPVVTHPVPGLKDNAQLELVDHGQTGLVATTAEDYAAAIAWLLNNPQEAKKMGLKGQEKARKLYHVQNIVQRLQEIYLELLQEAGIE